MEIVRTMKANQATTRCTFADLVDEYSGPVFKFCRSLTYSKEDAEDLFQETFFRAFEHLQKASALNNPQGYLFSTSLYVWKSWKQKYARRMRIAPLEPLSEAIASGYSMEDSLMAQEENRIVREMVEALPEKFKVPVILYYSVEMSVPDIALSLKLPVGTVKSRLFKARKLVEKGLVDSNYEE